MFDMLKRINWKSKTVRGTIVGIIGTGLAVWAGEMTWAAGAAAVWAALQVLFARQTTKSAETRILEAVDHAKEGQKALWYELQRVRDALTSDVDEGGEADASPGV